MMFRRKALPDELLPSFRAFHVAAWYVVVAEPVGPCALSTGLCIVDLVLHLLVSGIDRQAVRRALVADS